MPFDRKKAVIGVLIAGVAGSVLLLPAIFLAGFWLAPPLPVPAATKVAPLVADAIWARADGGRATALTPITPVSMAKFAGCVAFEDFKDDTPGDAQRVANCREYMPAIQALEYLSGVHMRDAHLQPSFAEGLSRLSTTVVLTHSWSKDELLRTLAERGEFGAGFRGLEAAARGYFGRASSELALPQAALLGAIIGVRRADPWCNPESAATLRHRVLERMHENQAIDEAAFKSADVAELGLVAPPLDHKPCVD